MKSKYQLYREIAQYENLMENLSNVSYDLSSASSSSSTVASTLKNHYKINDDSNKAVDRTNKLSVNISNKVDLINNTYIPAIKEAIEKAKEELARIEKEEEEARNASNRKW